MSDDVTLKQSSTVYSNPYLEVEDRTYSHDGREYRYVVARQPEFSVVGAVTKEGKILMMRQFRPGPGHFTHELPAGMVDPGDTPEETARKELLEETGYTGRIEAVTTAYVMAYSTAKRHIFLAHDCEKIAEPEEDPGVIGEPFLMDPQDFAGLLRSGDMLDLDAALILAARLGIPVF
ncbi:NUDIX hydrolase [Kordiimonas lacus]|uniref:GDP-mannose pyrophosphatase n=1 Tax=Kordiimonas lacus TaxID=637679 RepID=A0A1G7C1X8_9PROT|nr:NUDIX hydrolase [Kordiimonas lacus]SDE32435.1 ADP-ribose pyrophosphatase [Kordiimonas lacus]